MNVIYLLIGLNIGSYIDEQIDIVKWLDIGSLDWFEHANLVYYEL